MLGASSVTATASKSTTLSAQFFATEKLQFTKKEIKWIKTMYNGGGRFPQIHYVSYRNTIFKRDDQCLVAAMSISYLAYSFFAVYAFLDFM